MEYLELRSRTKADCWVAVFLWLNMIGVHSGAEGALPWVPELFRLELICHLWYLASAKESGRRARRTTAVCTTDLKQSLAASIIEQRRDRRGRSHGPLSTSATVPLAPSPHSKFLHLHPSSLAARRDYPSAWNTTRENEQIQRLGHWHDPTEHLRFRNTG
ncbi:hypothetical protein B0H16DRAFT_1482159 [Mycena metata]|uniref:Uncharacterized protein n=1 Tax=Mycena metata TaxID=1033252 RepID=A0AAD7M8S1_9AGAR|nr:hypothetical protein B0H16DRAFT_1482159 [Mycena metata]